MSLARPAALMGAWLLLIAVTVISFETAEYLDQRRIAVAAIMAIAAIKVALILRQFMDVGAAPAGIRIFFTIWTIACAGMIFGLWWFAAG